MMDFLHAAKVRKAIAEARQGIAKDVLVDGRSTRLVTPFPSPSDWRDCWIYFIMVDRFNNPGRGPDGAWNQPYNKFQGGTLEGIRAKLGYLQDLGVGAIWLSPVLKNLIWEECTYHGYGIHDFISLDSRFASDPTAAQQDPTIVEAEFRNLVDEAHARGIYVIMDIVLNHVGNVFGYGPGPSSSENAMANYNASGKYPIFWRDETGCGKWTTFPKGAISRDAGVWPEYFQEDAYYRCKGCSPGGELEQVGDFCSLKELVTEYDVSGRYPVRDSLVEAYQYVIAKYDIDGFRIDTFKHIDVGTARIFGNAIREFALGIGKKNFFMFGEIAGDDEKIAQFIGCNTQRDGEVVGIDAALDFPVADRLPGVIKSFRTQGGGENTPARIAAIFEHRKDVQRALLTSHGRAGGHFVTFLDNHDRPPHRFTPYDPANPGKYDDQLSLGMGLLFTLQGIPCVYYGTEQGLTGIGYGGDEAVREALWGKPNAFDQSHAYYGAIAALAKSRREHAALRYGRQYFRPISGDGIHFGVSPYEGGGVLAFSRILNKTELLVLANTQTDQDWSGSVIVDYFLNNEGDKYQVLYSNKTTYAEPGQVKSVAGADVTVQEVNGSVNHGGSLRVIPVTLKSMEIQVLGKPAADN